MALCEAAGLEGALLVMCMASGKGVLQECYRWLNRRERGSLSLVLEASPSPSLSSSSWVERRGREQQVGLPSKALFEFLIGNLFCGLHMALDSCLEMAH